MSHTLNSNLRLLQKELEQAQTELEQLQEQLHSFESRVDSRLGSLLDQLTELNADTAALDGQLHLIREQRLFGGKQMHYVDGAPRPSRPPDLSSQPPINLPPRQSAGPKTQASFSPSPDQLPDIKTIYRQLARRYHPDLARSPADRLDANEMMAKINQAYTTGDLPALLKLSGVGVPAGLGFGMSTQPVRKQPGSHLTELELLQGRLKDVNIKITNLTALPIVKLSLEVKLAAYAGRDLLTEIASDLRYKVARKVAERDYLQSQINAASNTLPDS